MIGVKRMKGPLSQKSADNRACGRDWQGADVSCVGDVVAACGVKGHLWRGVGVVDKMNLLPAQRPTDSRRLSVKRLGLREERLRENGVLLRPQLWVLRQKMCHEPVKRRRGACLGVWAWLGKRESIYRDAGIML